MQIILHPLLSNCGQIEPAVSAELALQGKKGNTQMMCWGNSHQIDDYEYMNMS